MFLKRLSGKNFHNHHLIAIKSYLSHQSYELDTSNCEQVQYQNYLFENEKKRIANEKVPRIEKIQVKYQGRGISDSAVMYMNKNMSTPHNCAMHISRNLSDLTVLAKITKTIQEKEDIFPADSKQKLISNEEQPEYWDMYREIPFDCNIQLLNFEMENASINDMKAVNEAYWRSSAMVLGATLVKAFKEKYSIGLIGPTSVPIESGAFCYDIELDESIADWVPSEENLIYLTKIARSIIASRSRFERLEVDLQFARKLFQDDKYRLARLPACSNGQVCLYRLGDFIELIEGPLIADSSSFFHFVVTAFHKVDKNKDQLRRVQGISLPESLKVHHAIWTMLENRARKLVKDNLPEINLQNDEEALDFFKYKSIEDKTKVFTKATGQWTSKFNKEDKPIDI